MMALPDLKRRCGVMPSAVALAFLGVFASCAGARPAAAAVCANGVYRAGCAGPNGAVVVNKAPYHSGYRPPYRGRSVTCASGPYRAGCAGPNGAVVRRY